MHSVPTLALSRSGKVEKRLFVFSQPGIPSTPIQFIFIILSFIRSVNKNRSRKQITYSVSTENAETNPFGQPLRCLNSAFWFPLSIHPISDRPPYLLHGGHIRLLATSASCRISRITLLFEKPAHLISLHLMTVLSKQGPTVMTFCGVCLIFAAPITN